MKILGAVIAGGGSTRMGREKSFVLLKGETLLARTLARLRPQVDDLIINANGPRFRFNDYRCVTVPDILTEVGSPLAGLHAVLRYALDKSFDAAVTVPCDSPFLPTDLVARLKEGLWDSAAAVAASGGQPHYLTGLWRVSLYDRLDQALTRKALWRVQDFVADVAAHELRWAKEPFDPFFNINTPEDLGAAEMHGDA